jgi:hypothetical protein
MVIVEILELWATDMYGFVFPVIMSLAAAGMVHTYGYAKGYW